jgi:hypothetical protein
MDKKKALLAGGGIAALFIGWKVLHYYENKSANQSTQDQTNSDASLLQTMATQPLVSSPVSSGANTGTSIDTGNEALQQMIDSVINPTGSVASAPVDTAHPVTGILDVSNHGAQIRAVLNTPLGDTSAAPTNPVNPVTLPVVIRPVLSTSVLL